MSLWSLSLPLALYPLTGPHWTLPFSVILSYVVLSIEDVGAEIEEPFHVLPLRQYTEGECNFPKFLCVHISKCGQNEHSHMSIH